MTGLFLVSYLLAPLVMLGCLLGGGLLVRRIAGGRLPAVYVLPLGFALMVTVATFLTAWDATAELTGPAFVILALAGLVVERRRLRPALAPAGRWAWAVGAAGAGYLVMIAPALLSGRATFTGYARIVDIAHQFDFARWLSTEGRLRPDSRDTSYLEVVTKTMDIGYPSGGQSTFAGFASLLGTDLVWVYQAFLAVTAAMIALAVYALLRGAIRSRALRGLAGAIAAQPNVLVGYGLVGGFKELVTAALIVLTAALVRETVPARASAREMVPLAVATAGALAAFNLTAVPWVGLVLAGSFAVTMLRSGPRLRVAGAWAAMAAITLVLAAPTVVQAVRLAPVAAQAEGAPGERTVIADLGNMVAPMPVRAASGVWISGDFRRPALGDSAATGVGIAAVVVLAALGLALAARRRDWGLVLVGGASAVALTYFSLRTGPWIQLKAITMTSPVALALAFAGAGALVGRRRRWRWRAGPVLGWGLAGVVSLAVLAGNANAYHDITLAPTERLRDLQRIGERLAGEGPAVYPAHEEYAEYFLRRSGTIGYVNGAGEGPGNFQLRPTAATQVVRENEADGPPRAWDPDAIELEWLQRFEMIVLRRGPQWSRPPSNYELALRTRFHTVWRRVRPASTVLSHVPLPGWDASQVRAGCADLVARARAAGEDARVAWVSQPVTAAAPLGAGEHSPAWKPIGPEAIIPYGAGSVSSAVSLPRAGSYRLWIRGPAQRELRVMVDGRRVATHADAWSYPGQWTLLEQLRLPAGPHTVRLEREGGNLDPADGVGGEPVGPLVFEWTSGWAGPVRTAPAARARDLCARPAGLDWIELVRPPERASAPRRVSATS